MFIVSSYSQRVDSDEYILSDGATDGQITLPSGKTREGGLFREALNRGREYRNYYVLINESSKMVSKEKLISICKTHDYIYKDECETKSIDRFGDKASSVYKFWFIPKSVYWEYVFEWTDRTSTRCENLKSRGSAWAFDVNLYTQANKMELLKNCLWSGNVVDGYVDGSGTGFCQLSEQQFFYFSGQFCRGFPVGKVKFRKFEISDGTSWGYSPIEKQPSGRKGNGAAFHEVEFGQMHDGMATFRYLDNGGDRSGKTSSLYGFVNQNGVIAISPTYKVVHDFSNGRAAVQNDKGEDIYINEVGQFVDYTESQKKVFADAKAEKERIAAEAERQRLLAEQKAAEEKRIAEEKRVAYLQKIQPLMDKSKWQRGDRLCLEFGRQGQYITGTLEEWNGDRSRCRIKIVTSPNGNMGYKGDLLTKNNLIWIPTSGEGWHKALPEEIEAANMQDNSIATQTISTLAKCPKCNGQKYVEYTSTDYFFGFSIGQSRKTEKCSRCDGTGFVTESQTIKSF